MKMNSSKQAENPKISIDIKHRKDVFDECNVLVLPSTKKKIKKKKEKAVQVKRLLTKKKRKQLEKVIERKKKKKNRAELINELTKTNIPESELKQYMSLAAIQTKGLKRHKQEILNNQKSPKSFIEEPIISDDDSSVEPTINSIKGAKKRRMLSLGNEQNKITIKDPNVIDLDISESSEDDCEISENDCAISENGCEIIENIKELNENEKEEQDKKVNDKQEEELKSSTVKEEQNNKVNSKQEKKSENNTNKVISKNLDDLKRNSKKKEEIKPAIFVHLDRTPEIQAARLKLPILAEEQQIVETINENSVIIITGETGSGKTTQVPQFLFEAGYARTKMIGITEPRRVAAVSMSKRVAEEMNLSSNQVSYLIRFEGNVTPETKIKFMTDGVLLKELQSDFLLKNYSVIILDEAHERSIYTDILIGLLTRIVSLRLKKNNPLKLIIMSATLRVEDFIKNPRLFKTKPPILNVESRQFPVTIHFNKKTPEDYIKETLRKTVKIHTELPDGGILIFLTGQREVNHVVKMLRKAFPYRDKKLVEKSNKIKSNNHDDIEEDSEEEFYSKSLKTNKKKLNKKCLPEVNLDSYSTIPPDDAQDDLVDIDTLIEEEDNFFENEDGEIDLKGVSTFQPLWVLPLYSLLSSERQAKVFKPPPEGCRLCVVSTNLAETSLTIPNVKYVIDSGKCKTRLYDKVTGVTRFVVTNTSKAGANQRAGRAGRTSAGHCYRLYSSAVFNDQFEDYNIPEICQKPVDDLILQMKVMNIDKVVNFPFPTPPGEQQLITAEKRLYVLGALKQPNLMQKSKELYCSKVTELGRSIAAFPVAPRFGKMLALSQQNNLIPYTICLVAALSVQELLIESLGANNNSANKWVQMRRTWASSGNSFLLGDSMILIRAVGAAEYASSKGKLEKFCTENGLREKAMTEVRKLRQQLTNEILLNFPSLDISINPRMVPPTDTEAKLLRQILLSGMIDHVARKLTAEEIKEKESNKKWKYAYKTLEMEEEVFMHSNCVLKKAAPEWVVYQEIFETNKIYMRGITAIEPEWLPKFAPSLCNLNDPLSEPAPRYDEENGKILCHRTGSFGPSGWELPMMELEYPQNLDGIKWFAYFLLEGEIFPKLKKFKTFLLTTPSSITKSWAKLVPRVEILTKQLLSKGIMSKSKLVDEWNLDSKFLLSAYQKWLPESAHAEVMLMWPPL